MTATYSRARVREFLAAGAQVDGRPTIRAAVHLILFTDLPDRTRFLDWLDVQPVCRPTGDYVQVGFVRWRQFDLELDRRMLANSAQLALARLAAGLATGQNMDVQACMSAASGHEHARRVVEAIAMATGADQFWTVTFDKTARLFDLEATTAHLAATRADEQADDRGHDDPARPPPPAGLVLELSDDRPRCYRCPSTLDVNGHCSLHGPAYTTNWPWSHQQLTSLP